jgi:hypothetical protein
MAITLENGQCKAIAASSIREVDSTRTAVDAQFCAVPIELSKDHRRSCVN